MRASWIRQAECAKPHMQPQWWDIVGNHLSKENRHAISICGRCPVRDQCWEEVQSHPSWHKGIIRAGRPQLTRGY